MLKRFKLKGIQSLLDGKSILSKNKHNQQQLYRHLLPDAINEKLQLEKDLNKFLTIKLSSLNNYTI